MLDYVLSLEARFPRTKFCVSVSFAPMHDQVHVPSIDHVWAFRSPPCKHLLVQETVSGSMHGMHACDDPICSFFSTLLLQKARSGLSSYCCPIDAENACMMHGMHA